MTKKRKQKDWFRIKRYPHIGLQYEHKDRPKIESYVKNKTKIKSHAFLPFIHRTIAVRKFRRKKLSDGSRSEKRIASYKEREVFYASHLDSFIFSYYADLINKSYEKFIENKSVSNCVTAYRQIKLNPQNKNSRNKCNVDFAKDIFDYIKANKSKSLVAITFDITSFFDNLNHRLLKEAWIKVLGLKNELPEDHYSIFRNLTKFAYIEIDDLFEEFKNDIVVKTKKGNLTRSKVPRLDLLKEKKAVAFCYQEDFPSRIRDKNLIKSNKWKFENNKKILRNKGIPQGSPISAILANVYLINFDTILQDFVASKGGVYQRYSDDMVVVIDEEYRDEIINKFQEEIKNVQLEIQPSKTQVYVFKAFDGEYCCKEFNIETKELSNKTKFDYLGFSFDGNHVYLKSSALAKYYRKMKRAFRRGSFYAKYGKNGEPKLFKNRLYKRFTYLGAGRRTIYKRDPSNPDKWIPTNKYDWGNFLSYTSLAYSVFNEDKIKKQIRNSWNIFHKIMTKKEEDIKSYHKRRKHK
nr:reverse transcriptase domain-containing protein [uncultured Psychroserpens sp.]